MPCRPRWATPGWWPTAAGGARTGSWRSGCPATPLAHVWPDLTDRRPLPRGRPAGRAPRGAPPHAGAARPPADRERSAAARDRRRSTPPDPVVAALQRAMPLDHVDPIMLAKAVDARQRARSRAPDAVRGARPSCTATSPSRTCSGTRARSPRSSTSSGPDPVRATSTSTSSCAAAPTPTSTSPTPRRAARDAEDYAEVPVVAGRATTRRSSSTRARSTACASTPSPTTCATSWPPRRRPPTSTALPSSTPTTGWPASWSGSPTSTLGRGRDQNTAAARSRLVAVTAGISPAAWGRICSQKKRAVRTLPS